MTQNVIVQYHQQQMELFFCRVMLRHQTQRTISAFDVSADCFVWRNLVCNNYLFIFGSRNKPEFDPKHEIVKANIYHVVPGFSTRRQTLKFSTQKKIWCWKISFEFAMNANLNIKSQFNEFSKKIKLDFPSWELERLGKDEKERATRKKTLPHILINRFLFKSNETWNETWLTLA